MMLSLLNINRLIPFCFILLSGCGGSEQTIGSVTYQGKKLLWGSVTLLDDKGAYLQGEIGANGDLIISNLKSGTYKVGVYSPKPPDQNDPRAKKADAPSDDPRAKFVAANKDKDTESRTPPKPGEWFPIPEKFKEPSTSGITVTVAAGKSYVISLE